MVNASLNIVLIFDKQNVLPIVLISDKQNVLPIIFFHSCVIHFNDTSEMTTIVRVCLWFTSNC
jgi:hypothetical protein